MDSEVIPMLDNKKIAAFIAEKRKAKGLTQQQVADALHISFQAVSKWESGASYPTIELLYALSRLLGTTTDELLSAQDSGDAGLTYGKAGVDISYTDSIKREMADYLSSQNPRVLNSLGPFASLYDIRFDEIENPVLVLKSEEPGSKQKLAIQHGYTESICHDMVNHLVNDIIVMGARPLAVLDTIICGNAEKDTIKTLVKAISEACRANECDLVGGETSVQPGVVERGVYILTASIAGIVDRERIIDGSRIRAGDKILALASNGLHTNGYSLVRHLMDAMPQIQNERLGSETFLEAIMKPHTPYYRAVKGLFGNPSVHGMAHITGGGIEGNLSRIMPDGLSARIQLDAISIPAVFKHIKTNGSVADAEMLKTFNCGVGLIAVVEPGAEAAISKIISKFCTCYTIGEVMTGDRAVAFENELNW